MAGKDEDEKTEKGKAAKHTKNVSTTAEGNDDLADASKTEMDQAASTGAADKPSPAQPVASYAFKGVQDTTKHPDWTTFRSDVENTAAGDLNQDPREPYPTGNPPDPKDEFAKIWGFRPGEGGKGGIAGAKDTPKPNPKD